MLLGRDLIFVSIASPHSLFLVSTFLWSTLITILFFLCSHVYTTIIDDVCELPKIPQEQLLFIRKSFC